MVDNLWEATSTVLPLTWEGKASKINGHDVLSMETMVKNNALFLIPEPKSPHGVDVSPDGKYIIVSGKLDSHAYVYDFAKIMKAIKDENFEQLFGNFDN